MLSKSPSGEEEKKKPHPLNVFLHIFSSSRIRAQSKYHAGRFKSRRRHDSKKVQDVCSGLRGGNQDTFEDEHSQAQSSQVRSALSSNMELV